MFLIGASVPLVEAQTALAPLPVDRWAAGGAVSIDGDEARALIVIRPLRGPQSWLVAHDFARPEAAEMIRPDHVLGISASTMALVGATIRRPIAAAFDLGTGCGVQALHASTHSLRVVASDLNPRALALATLTMELNRIDNVDVRAGDRFEPVAGERFDLIVANPPFVISPSNRYLFRDSELPLDELCWSIVRSAPAQLADGGHCQLLGSWAHLAGEDWRDRLGRWFEDTGCDALVLERERLDPSAHAASWLRQTEPPERWQTEYDEWLTYAERHRIESIGFGLITMRRRSAGQAWFRAEEAPQDFAMPCGDHLGAVFELADFLEPTRTERYSKWRCGSPPTSSSTSAPRRRPTAGRSPIAGCVKPPACVARDGSIQLSPRSWERVTGASDWRRDREGRGRDGDRSGRPGQGRAARAPTIDRARNPAACRRLSARTSCWPGCLPALDWRFRRSLRRNRGKGDLELAIGEREPLGRRHGRVVTLLKTGHGDVGQLVLQELVLLLAGPRARR